MSKSGNAFRWIVTLASIAVVTYVSFQPRCAEAADLGPKLQHMPDEFKLYGSGPDLDEPGLRLDIAFGYNFTANSPFTQNGYDGGFAGPDDTFRSTIKYVFPVAWRPSRCVAVQPWTAYTHVSHVSAGPPLNDKPEDFIDIFELGATVHFGCRR